MSHSSSTPSPMLARGAESGSGKVSPKDEPLVPPDADPDAIVERILSLLNAERFQTARRIALEAAERFPEHRKLQTARRIFDNREKATRLPGNEPSRKEEFAWLSNPPESARGKWVALIGSELIGAADDLAELVELLRSKQLPKPTLVHRID